VIDSLPASPHLKRQAWRLPAVGAARGGGSRKEMSKRVLQFVGAALLVLTLGVVSCQALFSGTTGLSDHRVDRSIR
jgi:hypothetical protein